ncbi:hypothetical protein [Streptomyces sp. NPDC056194]|uniref:hypothetical protein n=1 Tax=unclassified Streptomyces TaxID=2593676 RepID=UPI0035E1DC0C
MSTRSIAAAGVALVVIGAAVLAMCDTSPACAVVTPRPAPAPGVSPKAPTVPTVPRPGVAILPVPVVIDGDHDDPCEDR